MSMQDELVRLEREGAPERVIEDYAVRALEITHVVRGALEAQERSIVEEIAAISEPEQFFAAHAEQGPQHVGEAS